MKQNDIHSRKEKQEEACTRCFLEWYNKQHRAKYGLQRAEKAFPQLVNRTRWEFVARQREGDMEWLAIEVKGLVIPEARRQFMDWSKFFERVTKQLDCSLKGTFLVIDGAPALALNQKEQSQLRKAVVKTILDVAPKIRRNEKLDLGPEILEQFPSWPFTPHLEMKPQPHIMKNAHEFWLFKTVDSGCSVELGMSSAHTFSVQEAENNAIRYLFKATGKGAKANRQLGLAKEMGAKETFLLLDCHLPYRPEVIKQALTDTIPNFLSNIDKMYLVSVSKKQITDVTPF